ncbi:MAG: hypothetical protein NVV57_07240 [Demequina sp.]|jgi:hypothetical protein|nr:hypothetical protein [Demequina sp.]
MATILLFGVGACSATHDHANQPWSVGPYDQFIGKYIDEAQAGGASQEQIDALVSARDAGRIDVEQMREAVAADAECLEKVGFTVTVSDAVRASGYVVPTFDAAYPSDLSTEQGDAVVDACDRTNLYWISAAYQLQPEARDKLGAYVMSRESELRKCLEGHSYATDPDATGWELAMQALQVSKDTRGQAGFDCLDEAGIDGL